MEPAVTDFSVIGKRVHCCIKIVKIQMVQIAHGDIVKPMLILWKFYLETRILVLARKESDKRPVNY